MHILYYAFFLLPVNSFFSPMMNKFGFVPRGAVEEQKKYPISPNHYENYLKRLNSQNNTIQNDEILGGRSEFMKSFNESRIPHRRGKFRIIINPNGMSGEDLSSAFGNMFNPQNEDDDEDEDEDEEYDEDDLQKIDESTQTKIINNYHPELKTLNYEEIETLCTVVRDVRGNIIDPLHKTLPILSRYEKARILGERAEQINSGAQSFIELDPTMIDGYLIALKELDQKKIPFIIQRPLPNGGSEYWRLCDLEML